MNSKDRIQDRIQDRIRLLLNEPRALVVYSSICLNRRLRQAIDDAAYWWRLTRPGISACRFARFAIIAGQLRGFEILWK